MIVTNPSGDRFEAGTFETSRENRRSLLENACAQDPETSSADLACRQRWWAGFHQDVCFRVSHDHESETLVQESGRVAMEHTQRH